jgi:hypothetical protein
VWSLDHIGANALSIKSGLGGFMRLSQVILAENPDGSMPADIEGMKETSS